MIKFQIHKNSVLTVSLQSITLTDLFGTATQQLNDEMFDNIENLLLGKTNLLTVTGCFHTSRAALSRKTIEAIAELVGVTGERDNAAEAHRTAIADIKEL